MKLSTHIFTCLLLGLMATNAIADDAALIKRVETLEHAIENMKDESSTLPSRVDLGGQYRINSYSVDNDVSGDNQNASRVRIRQNIDMKFDAVFKTHLQLELGHTADNVTTTSSSSRATNINVRHAVLDYSFENKINMQAGIVPLADHFGDTLFSSDWDYNPVAVSLIAPINEGQLRFFAGNLAEGNEAVSDDDFVHYQIDYRFPLNGGNEINLGATLADVSDAATPADNHTHANYGIGIRYSLANDVSLNAYVIASTTDRALLGTTSDADGIAAKLEFSIQSGKSKIGLLVTHATGESDGSGFLPVMALAKTNGYWGYTGLLTVQGPTDTGFDGDSVNISNNGFGLTSIQAKYSRPVTSKLHAYLSMGWFGNSDTPSGRNDELGIDFLAMGTYRFNKVLALDFGMAHAALEDAVSGYSNGVIGGATFNQASGVERNKTALFSRLQAEF